MFLEIVACMVDIPPRLWSAGQKVFITIWSFNEGGKGERSNAAGRRADRNFVGLSLKPKRRIAD